MPKDDVKACLLEGGGGNGGVSRFQWPSEAKKPTDNELIEAMARAMGNLMEQGRGFDGMTEMRKGAYINQAKAAFAALRERGAV